MGIENGEVNLLFYIQKSIYISKMVYLKLNLKLMLDMNWKAHNQVLVQFRHAGLGILSGGEF